jgi:hypothetical protein
MRSIPGYKNSVFIFLSVVTFALVCASACDSEDDFDNIQSGLLSVNPDNLLFPSIPAGQSAQQELTIRNVGSATVSLVNIRINRENAPYEITLQNGDQLPDLITIEPDETVTEILMVTYLPTENRRADDSDELIIDTNSSQQRELSIPIRTSDATPNIFLSPDSFEFGNVDAGETEDLEAIIRNVGQGPLLVSRMYIEGSEDFTFLIDDEVINDNNFSSFTIEAGASKSVTLRYAPPTTGPDRADLVIISNDPQASRFNSPLSANGAAPCIQLTPDTLDFGAALLVADREGETPNRLPLIIESCGGAPLKITRVELEGAEFGLSEVLEPNAEGDLIELPAVTAGEPFPSRALEVGFWPTEEQNYGGRLLLYTNTQTDPLEVDLFGRGVENSCPIPVVTTERYEVAPLEIITLDGTPSADPGGEVKRWVWNVIERPSGSVSQVVESLFSNADPAGGGPVDDELTSTATFFVDLAGRYVIELEVYDNLDQASCAPNEVATVIIEAVPEKDLHIQLVWATPEDPDETDDSGTDVDLHFKHQNADDRWGSAAGNWDCYFQNTSPDWGNIGDFLDNPSLDIDDINGAGPENVNLNQPEVGVNYEVGAIYFRAESLFGEAGRDPTIEHSSFVTVRLFARGELIGEFVDRELNRLNQLWHVATINWCEDPLSCPVVTPIDRIYEEGEYAQ